jgi:catalase
MAEDERQRLSKPSWGGLSQVSREDIARRAIENFRNAYEDYGKRMEAAVKALRG